MKGTKEKFVLFKVSEFGIVLKSQISTQQSFSVKNQIPTRLVNGQGSYRNKQILKSEMVFGNKYKPTCNKLQCTCIDMLQVRLSCFD